MRRLRVELAARGEGVVFRERRGMRASKRGARILRVRGFPRGGENRLGDGGGTGEERTPQGQGTTKAANAIGD